MEGIDALAKGLAPFHEGLNQQQGCKQGIALGQVHAKAHPTGFLTAHQHLAAEHFTGDVLEPHGHFQHRAALGFGHELHQIGAAHGFDHGAG